MYLSPMLSSRLDCEFSRPMFYFGYSVTFSQPVTTGRFIGRPKGLARSLEIKKALAENIAFFEREWKVGSAGAQFTKK